MTAERLSALDASFLAVESPAAPMHVGWVSVFEPPDSGPSPTFDELADHIAGRLERVPRYRQRLASVPFGFTSRSGSTTPPTIPRGICCRPRVTT